MAAARLLGCAPQQRKSTSTSPPISLARLREHLADLVHDLIESEREACARIVEHGGTRSAIAALIRGRRP
jgi:hypothetical protein